jgi:hypothetical protein
MMASTKLAIHLEYTYTLSFIVLNHPHAKRTPRFVYNPKLASFHLPAGRPPAGRANDIRLFLGFVCVFMNYIM